MTTLTTQVLDASALGSSGAHRMSPLARLLVFLRTELAPSPARYRATMRIVISCVVATAIMMTLRIPNGHWLIVTIFIVSQPNVGASLDKAILRLVGTFVGATGVILTVVAFPQQPWFALPVIALLIGVSAFLSRTTSYPYVALLGGITIVLFLGTATDHPMASVTDGLWRLAVIALAEVIATAAQLLLWPDDPESLLLDDFVRILRIVERRLAGFADPADGTAPSRDEIERLRDSVFNGLARHLDLLANAETRHRTLRQRHAEQLVLIAAVNRIASASLTLGALLGSRPARSLDAASDEALRARLRACHDAIAAVRAALAERRIPRADELRSILGLPVVADDAPHLAPLGDLGRALGEMPAAMTFLDRSAERPNAREAFANLFLTDADGRFFTPACSWSNTRDLHFAGQVTIAAMISYLIVAGLRWPEVVTAVVTCVIVGQSSYGATVQKVLLLLAGATVGGLLGLAAILLVVPQIDSLPPFLILIAVCSAIAAYVVTGSARISYVGIQIALAFAMTLLDTFGPSIELVRPRDRVIGILLGNVISALVMFWVWPVLASTEVKRTLESALRHMAELSRYRVSGEFGQRVVRPPRGFRVQIFQDLASTLRLHGEAQFEPGAATPEHVEAQQRLLVLLHDAQRVSLVVAGLVRHRVGESLGEIAHPARAFVHALAVAVAPAIEAAADALAGKPVPAVAPLGPLVATAEQGLAAAAQTIDTPAVARELTELESQLDLYRSLTPLLERLTADARAASGVAVAT